ncbi:hypothetical protein Pa4123_90120 [Phytohabitans aurantiacus]|uniref:Uncharacterized protein n=1 Tax=Phytohabitans aurantiacus TaxID=3016789 RepID=A0ABQ5RCS6_9ACTN|nr:hypothetical protein Pa4123_90120 [Phytohabitans aurantiacus]
MYREVEAAAPVAEVRARHGVRTVRSHSRARSACNSAIKEISIDQGRTHAEKRSNHVHLPLIGEARRARPAGGEGKSRRAASAGVARTGAGGWVGGLTGAGRAGEDRKAFSSTEEWK